MSPGKTKELQWWLLLLCLLVFAACQSHSGDRKQGPPDLAEVTLKKDLSVSVDSVSPAIGSYISDIAVDQHGNMYLEDLRQAKIDVLDSNARYLYTIGRRGHGPGEFEFILNLKIYRDTLYVLESNPNRLSRFRLYDHRLIGVDNFPYFKVENHSNGLPYDFYPFPDGFYKIISRYNSGAASRSGIITSLADNNLIPADTVVRLFPPSQDFVYHYHQGGRTVVRYFGFDPLPKTVFAFGPHGDLYEAQTDSLIIHVFNRNGQKIKNITAVCPTPPITDTELDSVAEKVPVGYKKYFDNALDQNKIHGRRWPAMLKFLVDERGRCWVKLYKHGTTKQTWWVFDTNGKARWKFTLSGNLELCAVRKDEVYCVKNEKGEFPGIVRYHVEGL